MYHRFSNLTKKVIVFNIIISILISGFHMYNAYKLSENNKIIKAYMLENEVLRNTAIDGLKADGVELFHDKEMATYFGLCMCFLSVLSLYKFSQTNEFFVGFFSAVFLLLSSLIGGFLLFYLLFSGKTEKNVKLKKLSVRNEWEEFVHKRSLKT